MSTTEVLKTHAPEFVAMKRFADGTMMNEVLQAELLKLLEAYAQALLKLAEQQAQISYLTTVSRNLEGAIDELLAEREWRPIETAPRDGTIFDIWCNIGGTEYGYWGRLTNCYYKAGALWKVDDSESEQVYSLPSSAVKPTHWQPPPKPPGQKEEV